ncbi:brachyurin-like [Pectinophora gossypiella]|uniref:brachyurin-like n=1 Tax=Pectinophora gossypiella TaxID=13191 RepID=UPI00214E8E51|nr:brachyurin-like [Pectinophora gossypiella]
MKLVIIVLALAALAKATELPSNTVYGYLEKSIPAAEKIRKAEEEYLSQQRIIGGVPAAAGQYPWQAGLLIDLIGLDGIGVCGASLLNARRLVTAAHCWFDGRNQAWRFTVVLGSPFLFSGGVRVETSAVVTHPNWTPSLIRNDIAVIYLPNSVPLGQFIAPVTLPGIRELDQTFAGVSAVASGFGLTQDGGSVSGTLSHVRLNVITNSACSWAFPLILQSSNLCTSGVGTVGACSGDSGGPLVIEGNNGSILIGVVSFGSGLGCEANLPSVFVRVTSFLDFLHQHISW